MSAVAVSSGPLDVALDPQTSSLHHNDQIMSTPEGSNDKATEGAYMYWLASLRAERLQSATDYKFEVERLFDVRLPQVHVAHPCVVQEVEKLPPVDLSVHTPLFTMGMDMKRPTVLGCPKSRTSDPFFLTVYPHLRSISLAPCPRTVAACGSSAAPFPLRTSTLDIDEALTLGALLKDKHCLLKFLDMSGALSVLEEPQPAPLPEALSHACEEISCIVNEGRTPEEAAEFLQGEVERFKGEYTEFEAGITFLAQKRLERVNIIFDALRVNKSLLEVRLCRNGFGAADDLHMQGLASQQPWNRLAKVLDENETLRILDLSDNGCGPQGIGVIAKAMCKNIGLHTLDLSGNLLGAPPADEEEDPEFEEDDPVFGEMYQGFEALSEMLKKNKFLRYLGLRNNFIEAEGVAEDDEEDFGADTPFMKFLEPLQKYQRLRILDLANNNLQSPGARLLWNTLKKNTSITQLNLSGNHLGPKGLQYMAQLVKENSTIVALYLSNNEFVSQSKSKKVLQAARDAATSFSEAVATNSTLQHLNLSENYLGSDVGECMLHCFEKSSSLTELYLDNNDLCSREPTTLDNRALKYLWRIVTVDHSALSVLSLRGNCIQDTGIVMLTSANEPLVELNKPNSGVAGEAEPVTDGEAVPTEETNRHPAFSRLRHLDLGDNFLTDVALDALVNHLVDNNNKLFTLSLSNNRFTNIASLARLLQHSPELNRLDLSRNLIGGRLPAWREEEIVLCVGGKKKSLQALTVDSTDVKANWRGFTDFLLAVRSSFSSLHTLNLSYNNICDSHVEAIIALINAGKKTDDLHPLCTLRELLLMQNPQISTESVIAILSALAENKVLQTFRISPPYHSGTDGQHRVLKAALDTLNKNKSLHVLDCALQMDSVVEEANITKMRQLLLLNQLGLSRSGEDAVFECSL